MAVQTAFLNRARRGVAMASPLVVAPDAAAARTRRCLELRSVLKAINSIDGAGSPSGKKGEEETEDEVGGDFGPLDGSGVLVRIETDVLDCSICDGALRPPIHQCPTGHVACSACFVSPTTKCPSCSQVMGDIRCLALESVIESVKIRCINARYGCDEILSYLNRADHQKSCLYTPVSCLLSSCSFQGSLPSLSKHVADNHENSALKFRYDRLLCVTVTDEAFFILLSPDNRVFLLVNNVVTGGRRLSVICLCPDTDYSEIIYVISVFQYPTDHQLNSAMVHPKVFLFVPDEFYPGGIQVIVSIKKAVAIFL